MKKKIANVLKNGNNDFSNKRIDEDYFNGFVSLLKLKDIEKPWIINDFGKEECIFNNNFEWLEIYPDNEKYAITAMFDDKSNLIEWYFDMIKDSGVENGVPYIYDLYLDYVIKADGREVVLDEDELQAALDNMEIAKEDYNMAYKTMELVKSKYKANLNDLKDLTSKLYQKFN